MSSDARELRANFAGALLPANFHYRDEAVAARRPSAENIPGVSAVLILLNRVDGSDEWTVLMNVRSKALRRHPGEVCFPGGMREPHIDATPADTALREANEEIGLMAKDVEVVGTLKPIVTRHAVVIYPVLAILVEPLRIPAFTLSAEVDHFFWTALRPFLYRKRYGSVLIEEDFRIHGFLFEKPIFGITAFLAIAVAIGIYDTFPQFDFEAIGDRSSNADQLRSARSFLAEIFDYIGEVRPAISPEFIRSKLTAAVEKYRKNKSKI